VTVLQGIAIDRNSPVPLYFQLAQHLENEIRSGGLAVGSRLDNEIQIAQDLGLSRPTVRRALQYLVDRGMLVRRRGIGTQVVGAQVRRDLELTSLFEDLSRSDREPSTQVLSYGITPADSAVAYGLGVEEGAPVLVIERLRLARGEPLAIMHNGLPARFAEAMSREELETRGLYQLLRNAGVHLRLASQRIGARKTTPREAKLLHESRGAAVLTMERTAYDDHGQPVEHGWHVYRSSLYSFELTLAGR
jgi:DNA-binding GntR family transcriptional regulator